MKITTGRRKPAAVQTPDLYQQVTDKIILALENGVPP
ncbi:TPA: DNA primase, partial [Raoultella ornithinolytica]